MPYANIIELPESVRNNLPDHAQEIYLKAYNNAWNEYKEASSRRGNSSREETAHKVAWAAVEKLYRKNAKTGRWERI
jgi:cation transport regulator